MFVIFWEHVSCHLPCRRLVDFQSNWQVRSFLSRYHGYHIFVHLCRVFRYTDRRFFEKAIYLYRDVVFFHQFDRAYVSPFSKLLCFKRTMTVATIKRKSIYEYFRFPRVSFVFALPHPVLFPSRKILETPTQPKLE